MMQRALIMAVLAPAVLSPVIASSLVYQPQKPKERQASCVVMIQNYRNGAAIDYQTISKIVLSSGVAGRAAKEVLGLDPESYHKTVDVNVGQQPAPRDLFIHLSVGLDADEGADAGAADRYLAAVLERFSNVMTEAIEAHRAGVANELKVLKEQSAHAAQKLEGLTLVLKDLRTRPGLRGLSAQEMRFEGSRLRQEAANHRMNLSSLRSQLEMARLQPLEGSSPSLQDLAAEWQKVVELRQAKLEELRARAAKEAISPVELAEFEAALAEARAELLAYAQAPPRRARGIGPRGVIRPVPVSGGAGEAEAQLNEALERLEKFDEVEAMRIASELESRENEERYLRERLSALHKQIDEIEQALRLTDTFSLKILGAEAKPAAPPLR